MLAPTYAVGIHLEQIYLRKVLDHLRSLCLFLAIFSVKTFSFIRSIDIQIT